jgi:DNA polymerase III sliding clamp (beta) subunit (PCNA family)
MRSGFEEKGLVGSGWTVNCDGGGPGFMVKVTKQGLSLEANSYPWSLKTLATEETRMIEAKGVDPVPVSNFTRVIMTTNEDQVTRLEADDRRFFIVRANDRHIGDTEYFNALYQELDNGGYERLLYELLERELSGKVLKKTPTSSISSYLGALP